MSIEPFSENRKVNGIEDADLARIRDFMQGAIYCWAKNRPREEFAVRDLVGGENADWNDTPLEVLYTKHINLGKEPGAAYSDAAKDLGWIVKQLITDDRRNFFSSKLGLVRAYQWDGRIP